MSETPLRRSSSRKKSKPKISSEAVEKQQDKWVFLSKSDLVNGDYSQDDDIQPSMCRLRHPRLDQGVLFCFSADCKSVFEVNSFQEKFRSWFIGDTVHSDGQIFLTTPVDPVFLILPYLINAGKSNRFMSLDQIVLDDDFPDCDKLLSCSGLFQLDQVSDMKDVDEDLQVYRYNSEKAMTWLQAKTEMAADALQAKQVAIDSHGSQSAIFIRSKKKEVSRDSYLRLACGLISDYLPVSVGQELKDALGFDEKDNAVVSTEEVMENEPPAKKHKADISPTEDYSQKNDMKKERPVGKLTASQRKLSKVDKTGMKSIASFFGKAQT